MRRVTATSVKSMGNVWSVLSSTSVTSAKPTAPRAEEPEKITPKTHKMASDTFDLPEPLGPTTTLRPGSKTIWVLSAKDLKPLSVSDFRYKRVCLSGA